MTRAVVAKDLRVLWASPLPWIAGALLYLALGLLYVDQIAARRQAVIQPLFPLAGFLLIVIVPVLTTRSFAEEARTGTLELLQAVPVPSGPLAAGKWAAAWVTTVVLLAPATVFVVLLRWWGDPDLGPVTAGFAGLVLFSAGLVAVGVLASSLTPSQPVAAVVAVITSLVLWFAHAGPDTGLAGGVLVRLSLSERLRGFAGGAVSTADVGYFAVLTAAALVATTAALDARRLR